MPRQPTERPIQETMAVVLRVMRQLDLNKKLGSARKRRVKEALAAVMDELQAADQGKR